MVEVGGAYGNDLNVGDLAQPREVDRRTETCADHADTQWSSLHLGTPLSGENLWLEVWLP